MKKNSSSSHNNSIELELINPLVESYMRDLVSHTNHSILFEMEEYAQVRRFPIVNRLVGIFLYTQAKMINAERVFEFGSGFGYSAYWFAKAVGNNGCVICSDTDAANLKLAEKYLSTTDLWSRIKFNVGKAQVVFSQVDGLFDICYNDVDKGDYPEIWQMAKKRLRPGGLYIADNVLWHGRVVQENRVDSLSRSTKSILKHNQLIFEDSEFDAFINPIRDGVIVARKK